jgi:hypothetical protein
MGSCRIAPLLCSIHNPVGTVSSGDRNSVTRDVRFLYTYCSYGVLRVEEYGGSMYGVASSTPGAPRVRGDLR